MMGHRPDGRSRSAYLETHPHQGLGWGFGGQVEFWNSFEEIDMGLTGAIEVRVSCGLHYCGGLLGLLDCCPLFSLVSISQGERCWERSLRGVEESPCTNILHNGLA